MTNSPPARIAIVAGPTASGKSARALERAQAENGVVINADAMQLYDALPVLTAKPTADEQAQAPHCLYGAMHPAEKCTAARWRDLALAEIGAALAAGQTPIICGGTGFYILALTEGLSPIPDVPEEIHRAGIALQRETGNPGFHALLAERDPVMAARLNPGDTQRLIRAWEVLEATGESLAHWQSLPKEGPPTHLSFEFEILTPDRTVLYERIDRRFDAMIEAGVLDEVDDLDARIRSGEVPEDAPIVVAHGFRPLRSYLHGERTLEDAVAQSKQETRNYAKRQFTWWRKQFPLPSAP